MSSAAWDFAISMTLGGFGICVLFTLIAGMIVGACWLVKELIG